MKKKQIIHVQEDQTFLEGINPITGLKINYDRPVLVTNLFQNHFNMIRHKHNSIPFVQIKNTQKNKKPSKYQNPDKHYKNGHYSKIQPSISHQKNNHHKKFSQLLKQIFINLSVQQKYYEDLQSMFDMIAVGLNKYLALCVEELKGEEEELVGKRNIGSQNNRNKENVQYGNGQKGIGNNKTINNRHFLSEKSEKILFRILIRSFTDQKYNKIALQQWSNLFCLFFQYMKLKYIPTSTTSQSPAPKTLNQMIQQCLQYISGSFSMNTPPQRRRIAFQMMKGLIQHSQKVKQRTKTKITFFNNDTNSKTRIVICQLMGKLLQLQPTNQQTRKYILDYFNNDNAYQVIETAFYFLLSTTHQKHINAIFNKLLQIQQQQQNHQNSPKSLNHTSKMFNELFIQNLDKILTPEVSSYIKQNKKYKIILLNKINSILKGKGGGNGNGRNQKYMELVTYGNNNEQIHKIFPYLDKIYMILESGLEGANTNKQSSNKTIEEKVTPFLETFIIDSVDFEIQENFKSLLKLYKNVQKAIQNKEQYVTHPAYKQILNCLSFYVYKYLTKSQKIKTFFVKSVENLQLYFSVFTFQSEQQTSLYISILFKMHQQSKWPSLSYLLHPSLLSKISLTESTYEKLSQFLTKLITTCSYNLIQTVSQSILYLMLNKRKYLQFFLSIKEKLITSKNWVHRKNYIVLYMVIKLNTSYQFHKIIPVLNYRLVNKEKSIGLKLEFLKCAARIYQSIEQGVEEKAVLKQTVMEMISNQKDQDILEKARQVHERLLEMDSFLGLEKQRKTQRNIHLLQQEQRMRQRQSLMINNMKKNKTQKQLGRKDSKSKTITIQSRTSLRVTSTNPNNTTNRDIPIHPSSYLNNKQHSNKRQAPIINIQKLMKRPSTTTTSNKQRSLPKSEDQKKQPGSTTENNSINNNTHSGSHSASSSSMNRYMSGQMKTNSKVTNTNTSSMLKRQSGFKK